MVLLSSLHLFLDRTLIKQWDSNVQVQFSDSNVWFLRKLMKMLNNKNIKFKLDTLKYFNLCIKHLIWVFFPLDNNTKISWLHIFFVNWLVSFDNLFHHFVLIWERVRQRERENNFICFHYINTILFSLARIQIISFFHGKAAGEGVSIFPTPFWGILFKEIINH